MMVVLGEPNVFGGGAWREKFEKYLEDSQKTDLNKEPAAHYLWSCDVDCNESHYKEFAS